MSTSDTEISTLNIEVRIVDNNTSEQVLDRLDISGNWDFSEKCAVVILLGNLSIALLLGLFGYIFEIEEIQLNDNFKWVSQLVKVSIVVVLYLLGLVRYTYTDIGVQYTRKTFHIISLLLLPYIAYETYKTRLNAVEYSDMNLLYFSYYECLWTSFFLNLSIVILCKPIRQLDNLMGYFSRIAFLAINRDEDRPYTILWFMLQISAVSLVETPMTIWFAERDRFHLFWIPVFASGLGDGLAEIVGKKWGQYEYSVKGLCTENTYVRTLEGSACVWFFTFIGVLIGGTYYDSTMKFVTTAILLPILTTIVEAISPHTWDNHFIFGSIWFFLWVIFDVWK